MQERNLCSLGNIRSNKKRNKTKQKQKIIEVILMLDITHLMLCSEGNMRLFSVRLHVCVAVFIPKSEN